eukprot:gnl/Trimastix_PCT/1770.p1 GENE.gnl/Trimastix_PCT/1770~~gnl/Trimastix_PCT/1770.p1  ORF type:complete len:345 (+),score=86.66 gnl/Trimastix_PCT/1770:272-1306(+)
MDLPPIDSDARAQKFAELYRKQLEQCALADYQSEHREKLHEEVKNLFDHEFARLESYTKEAIEHEQLMLERHNQELLKQERQRIQEESDLYLRTEESQVNSQVDAFMQLDRMRSQSERREWERREKKRAEIEEVLIMAKEKARLGRKARKLRRKNEQLIQQKESEFQETQSRRHALLTKKRRSETRQLQFHEGQALRRLADTKAPAELGSPKARSYASSSSPALAPFVLRSSTPRSPDSPAFTSPALFPRSPRSPHSVITAPQDLVEYVRSPLARSVRPAVTLTIDLENGAAASLHLNPGDDVLSLAKQFCAANALPEHAAPAISTYIHSRLPPHFLATPRTPQ